MEFECPVDAFGYPVRSTGHRAPGILKYPVPGARHRVLRATAHTRYRALVIPSRIPFARWKPQYTPCIAPGTGYRQIPGTGHQAPSITKYPVPGVGNPPVDTAYPVDAHGYPVHSTGHRASGLNYPVASTRNQVLRPGYQVKRAGYPVGSTGYRAPGTRYPVMDRTKYLVPRQHSADPVQEYQSTGSGRIYREGVTPRHSYVIEVDHESGLRRRVPSQQVQATVPLDPTDPASMGYPLWEDCASAKSPKQDRSNRDNNVTDSQHADRLFSSLGENQTDHSHQPVNAQVDEEERRPYSPSQAIDSDFYQAYPSAHRRTPVLQDDSDDIDPTLVDPLLQETGYNNLDQEEVTSKVNPFQLSSAYEAVFDSLTESVCPRPQGKPTKQTQFCAAGEAAFWRLRPENQPVKIQTSSLPLSDVVRESFAMCDRANASSTERNWHVPTTTLKNLIHTASYRPPAVDDDFSLNLAALASLDNDAARLHLPKTIPSHSINVPSSMLERWEMKQRQALGLTSQLDWFSAAIVALTASDNYQEDLNQVLLFLSRTVRNLAVVNSSNLAEILRLRRSSTLDKSKALLLNTSREKLLSAPLSTPYLFGGVIEKVMSSDKEEQIHENVASRKSSYQIPLKRRAPAEAGPPPKRRATTTNPPRNSSQSYSRGYSRPQSRGAYSQGRRGRVAATAPTRGRPYAPTRVSGRGRSR